MGLCRLPFRVRESNLNQTVWASSQSSVVAKAYGKSQHKYMREQIRGQAFWYFKASLEQCELIRSLKSIYYYLVGGTFRASVFLA